MINLEPPTAAPNRAHEAVSPQTLLELDALFTHPAKTLSDLLNALVFGGEAALFNQPVKSLPVFRTSDSSGYNFSYQNKMVAYFRFGVTTSGYFVIQARNLSPDSGWISHYYSAEGKYAFTEGPISHEFAKHPDALMEPRCPVLNHIYNILAANYSETKSGKINTQQVFTLESFLRRLSRTRFNELSVFLGAQDGALVALRARAARIELDPVYTWKERHHLIRELKQERSSLVATKRRAHRLSRFRLFPALLIQDAQDLFTRFSTRPFSNALGLLERLLIDPLRWFGGVVRNNMGYSIALAIYSPFTFFFITQPMNPHAMWAVGNVRSAYLQAASGVAQVLHLSGGKEASTQSGASPQPAAAVISTTKAVIGNMEVTANRDDLDHLSWEDRMSHFKAMEIGYEQNMEIAPRMGRLEQMETQLNWPMIIEGAWLETDRYLNFLNFIEANAKDYQESLVKYVKNEHERTDQVQLYLWDKNVRFILDHPYTLMDQGQEQTQRDYYVGRSFILLKDMTSELAKKYKSLPIPVGYDAIAKLAQKYEAEYQSGGSLLERLKLNSKVFQQKDSLDTEELRSYMKRQWELLYLLQNKTQEASNMGLQLYIWSVRNTAYLLQSLYSSKREELSMLALHFKRGEIVNKISNNATFKQTDSQFEALYHMMVLEFASLKKELGESLKQDLETTQRKKIIAGVESFLKERDTLLKNQKLL